MSLLKVVCICSALSFRENALLLFVKEISIKKKKKWKEYGKIFNPLVVVYRYENSIGDLNPRSRRKHKKQEGKLFLLYDSKNLNHSVLF